MQYLGYDVLAIEPNRTGDRGEEWSVGAERIDNRTGRFGSHIHAETPTPIRPFVWLLERRAAVKALREWFDARRGRLVAFWAPSWQGDFHLIEPLAVDASALRIRWCGYTAHSFPLRGRKHVALISTDGTMEMRRVAGAVDEGDGSETLTLDAPAGVAIHPRQGLVCLLHFCRLADDNLTITWHSHAVAEAEARMIELPAEAP